MRIDGRERDSAGRPSQIGYLIVTCSGCSHRTYYQGDCVLASRHVIALTEGVCERCFHPGMLAELTTDPPPPGAIVRELQHDPTER